MERSKQEKGKVMAEEPTGGKVWILLTLLKAIGAGLGLAFIAAMIIPAIGMALPLFIAVAVFFVIAHLSNDDKQKQSSGAFNTKPLDDIEGDFDDLPFSDGTLIERGKSQSEKDERDLQDKINRTRQRVQDEINSERQRAQDEINRLDLERLKREING
jgi:hypothetical protein